MVHRVDLYTEICSKVDEYVLDGNLELGEVVKDYLFGVPLLNKTSIWRDYSTRKLFIEFKIKVRPTIAHYDYSWIICTAAFKEGNTSPVELSYEGRVSYFNNISEFRFLKILRILQDLELRTTSDTLEECPF